MCMHATCVSGGGDTVDIESLSRGWGEFCVRMRRKCINPPSSNGRCRRGDGCDRSGVGGGGRRSSSAAFLSLSPSVRAVACDVEGLEVFGADLAAREVGPELRLAVPLLRRRRRLAGAFVGRWIVAHDAAVACALLVPLLSAFVGMQEEVREAARLLVPLQVVFVHARQQRRVRRVVRAEVRRDVADRRLARAEPREARPHLRRLQHRTHRRLVQRLLDVRRDAHDAHLRQGARRDGERLRQRDVVRVLPRRPHEAQHRGPVRHPEPPRAQRHGAVVAAAHGDGLLLCAQTHSVARVVQGDGAEAVARPLRLPRVAPVCRLEVHDAGRLLRCHPHGQLRGQRVLVRLVLVAPDVCHKTPHAAHVCHVEDTPPVLHAERHRQRAVVAGAAAAVVRGVADALRGRQHLFAVDELAGLYPRVAAVVAVLRQPLLDAVLHLRCVAHHCGQPAEAARRQQLALPARLLNSVEAAGHLALEAEAVRDNHDVVEGVRVVLVEQTPLVQAGVVADDLVVDRVGRTDALVHTLCEKD
eukprot:Rhum_TRINITY_DN14982_c1_g1::Rhum_TRINITY_DN14982_c1_g1_i1::g.131217::m.131217